MAGILRNLRYCLAEARPAVLLITLLRYAAGTLLATHAGLHPARIAIGAVGCSGAAFAVYVFNGVTDRKEDVANGSRRPIAAGALPVRFAARAAAAAAVLSLVCGLALGTGELSMICAYLLFGYAYSGRPFRFKQFFGTVMPSVMVLGLATYFAGTLATGSRPGARLVAFAVANVLWMAVVGGISKDFSDVPGDRVAGRRSWPIVVGMNRARVLLSCVAVAVAVGFYFAAARYAVGLEDCAAVMVLGSVTVAVMCLFVRPGASRARCRLPYRAFMWTQHASHLVLLCTLGVAAV